MGVMQFAYFPKDRFARGPDPSRGYMTALDTSVWPMRIEIRPGRLVCHRPNADSCRFHLPIPVAGHGCPLLSTAWLPEREKPYLLSVELARGKIVQLRNQSATWQAGGMRIPPEFTTKLSQSQKLFASAASSQDQPETASRLADDALKLACDASDILMASYTQQRLETRHRQYPLLPVALGAQLPGPLEGPVAASFLSTFHACGVVFDWESIEPSPGRFEWDKSDRFVEWCLSHSLVIRGGPLLDLTRVCWPSWLRLGAGETWKLEEAVCRYVAQVVNRYQGQIRVWEISTGGNAPGQTLLSEEQRLTLVARTLEAARQADSEGHFQIGVGTPWSEYQHLGGNKLSALQFADALSRAGLGVASFNLELPIGDTADRVAPRDTLEVSRLLDLWSTLGLPLQVSVSIPTQTTTPTARSESDPSLGAGANGLWRAPWSDAAQADWVREFVPLLISKASLVSLFFTEFLDQTVACGLLRADHSPRPALGVLQQLRQTYWST